MNARLNEGFGHLEEELAVLRHRSSPQRQLALRRNALAADAAHSLFPVPHPDTGALPADNMFPATVAGESGSTLCCWSGSSMHRIRL